MTKAEFLEELRRHLAGQMQDGKVLAHVRYYEDYIEEQIRSGKEEQQVLEELGDPRLIAKTLRDTDAGSDSNQEIYEERRSGESSEGGSSGSYRTGNVFHIDFSKWYVKVLAVVAVIVILVVLFSILSAVLPFFIVLAVILFVLSWLKNR